MKELKRVPKTEETKVKKPPKDGKTTTGKTDVT